MLGLTMVDYGLRFIVGLGNLRKSLLPAARNRGRIAQGCTAIPYKHVLLIRCCSLKAAKTEKRRQAHAPLVCCVTTPTQRDTVRLGITGFGNWVNELVSS